MKLLGISIIIPTYKREKKIISILKSLKKQKKKNLNLQILICDSFSHYRKELFKSKNKNFEIKYSNIKENNLSAKRNYGIKNSKYKNIILIDDDCIPDRNFIKNYIKDFSSLDDKTILSGIVDYPIKYIKKYNHISFKNKKHFKSKYTNGDQIPSNKIVAMNLGFIKSQKMSKIGYFNKKFTGYGFEDHEFGHRYKINGYKLMKTNARIIHDEGKPNINIFSKKYYHLARDGMKNFVKINEKLAKSTIFYKLETNFLFILVVKLPLFNCLLLFIEKLIISTDKMKFLNFSIFYEILRFSSYTRGYISRNRNNLKVNKFNWYE